MAGQPPAAPAPRPAAPATKTARQSQIVGILSREQVHSQEQLAGLLAKYAGLHVTQATLSRDLDELGVVRLRAADGALVYALASDPGGPGSRPGTGLDLSHQPERTRAAAPDPDAGHADAEADGPASTGVGDPAGDAARPQAAASDAADDRSPAAQDGAVGGGIAGTGATARAEQAGPSSPPAGGPDQAASAAARASQPSRPLPGLGVVSSRFTRYLKELLTSAEGSANIVVLRTPAGAAQFLASTIDHAAWPAILGTVAGDDTVLVISRDPAGGEALAAQFRQLAEGRR